MEKVLIKSAINNETIYYIDNKNDKSFTQLYYFLINGMIKFIDIKKIKLNRSQDNEDIPEEYFDNILIELKIQYMNLNKFDTHVDIFKNDNCHLVDTDGYYFDIISMDEDNKINYFVPKIWQNLKLTFLVPDEDIDYYFQIPYVDFREKND